MRSTLLIISSLLLLIAGCRNREPDVARQNVKAKKNSTPAGIITPGQVTRQPADSNKTETLTLLVIQCYNSYDYASGGWNFNPVIEAELNKFDDMEIIPFPYKKLMNVAYQGIYDKKYCGPILERVPADYYIMTRFVGPRPDTPFQDSLTWGYEIKILNTRSMNQKVSIGRSNMEDYTDIEEDIIKNIDRLYKDIKTLE